MEFIQCLFIYFFNWRRWASTETSSRNLHKDYWGQTAPRSAPQLLGSCVTPIRLTPGAYKEPNSKLLLFWVCVFIHVSAPEAYSSTFYFLQYFRIIIRGRQCINHVQKDQSRPNPKPST